MGIPIKVVPLFTDVTFFSVFVDRVNSTWNSQRQASQEDRQVIIDISLSQ